jgi:hypothetical protein
MALATAANRRTGDLDMSFLLMTLLITEGGVVPGLMERS